MEEQTGTIQQQNYQSLQWSRLVRRNTQPSPTLASSSLAHPLPFTTLTDIPANLLPQQPVDFQYKLAHYNKLLESGKTTRLQSYPLPPVVSAQTIHALPRANTPTPQDTVKGKRNARGRHENTRNAYTSNSERPLMTEGDSPATMSSKKFDLSNPPSRRSRADLHLQSNMAQQSSSVPSTPHQHPRKFSVGSREPSPDAAPNHSPRSAYSESNSTLPTLRPFIPQRYGCKFETAMAQAKRRMAYSIGTDKLERVKPSNIKQKLLPEEEKKLTLDGNVLFDQLLPSPGSEERRHLFVQKLERLLNNEWPGHDIRVHMFGSSGNLLHSDDSDVDICITTPWKALEGVCMLAEVLAKHGYQKVICVSTAKVPIVKIWDPEFSLACDMNVNNTLALENTRMVKTYVQIDDRVRPLAMIIKHWTKRRAINDAAFGGTLSSYTWMCMIINFLQTRKPPVLPALHQRPHQKLPAKDGVESSFADDIDALRGYGKPNTESLGELLFQFFKFYAHDIDFDKSVISVRAGKLVSKVEKGWQISASRLCVEEPFNTVRNLANTADDTSVRGLHMELRRAFDLIAEAKLEECCEQYVYPKEELRVWEKPAPQPRPVLVRSASQSRGGRGGGNYRGARHNNHSRNGNNSSRRASSASAGQYDAPNYGLPSAGMAPPPLTSQEQWLRNQAAQEQLHNDLYTTFSVLQAQENNLRMQLYNQSQLYAQAHNQVFQRTTNGVVSNGMVPPQQPPSDRNRGNSFDNPPLTAPLRQDMYFYPFQLQPTSVYGHQSPTTYPSSPSMAAAIPELPRRSLHRQSVTNGLGGGSSGSLRSHSQPAARSGPSSLPLTGATTPNLAGTGFSSTRQSSGVNIPNFIADESFDGACEVEASVTYSESPPGGTVKEYVGWYVDEPPTREAVPAPVPSFGDIQGRRRQSTEFPKLVLDRIRHNSRSPSPQRAHTVHGGFASARTSQPFPQPSNLRDFSGQHMPLASPALVSATNRHYSTPDKPELPPYFIPAHAYDLSQTVPLPTVAPFTSAPYTVMNGPSSSNGRVPNQPHIIPVVNGSASRNYENDPVTPSASMVNGRTYSPKSIAPSDKPPREGRSSLEKAGPSSGGPSSGRQSATGGGVMSPLDVGLGLSGFGAPSAREDLALLSPVQEMRTPSPTISRRLGTTLDNARGAEVKKGSPTLRDTLAGWQSTGSPLTQSVSHNASPSSKALASGQNSSFLPLTQSVSHNTSPSSKPMGSGPNSSLSSSKPAGHTRGSKSESGAVGSWQQKTSKKKKGQGGEQKLSEGQQHGGAERAPKRTEERRGG